MYYTPGAELHFEQVLHCPPWPPSTAEALPADSNLAPSSQADSLSL